jgi:DNA-binding CsgD family transcriptional regulator
VVERVEAISRQPLDAGALRGQVLDVLRDAIGFDAYVWVLTDPVSTVGAAPLADIPLQLMSALPDLIRAKYLGTQNRWTALMHTASQVAVMDSASGGDNTGDSAWTRLLAGRGIPYVASVVFADQFGCWGFLDLWRDGRREPFRASDAELLAITAPVLTSALRECQARTFVEAATAHRNDVGPVVLSLDDELRIVARTAASQEWLDVLLPPGPGDAAIPASVYHVAAQLLANERGVDTHPASTRTHLSDGFWLTLRAARIVTPGAAGTDGIDGIDGIVVTIEEASAAERLELFARAFALSSRESKLFGLLATGADTRAMARRMAVSEHTVQDHLKSIFAKTGARDRVTLLSRALGTRITPGS